MTKMTTMTTSSNATAQDRIDEVWAALRAHLAHRAAALNDEVRHYPTPIARCDEQLPHLLEQRARAVRQQRLAEETELAASRGPAADRPKLLAEFLTASDRVDDDIGRLLRGRLADALSAAANGDDGGRSAGQRQPPDYVALGRG